MMMMMMVVAFTGQTRCCPLLAPTTNCYANIPAGRYVSVNFILRLHPSTTLVPNDIANISVYLSIWWRCSVHLGLGQRSW